MRYKRPYVLLLIPALLLLFQAAAQSRLAAAEELRTWTARDGEHSTDATFVGYAAGKVHLKKPDGKTVEVPLIQLSDDDQAYVLQVAPDDPKSLQALEALDVQMEKNKEGRVAEVRFPASRSVTERHIEHLGGLPNLQRLSLAEARVGEGALEGIENLPELRHIDFTASGIGDAEVRQLRALKKVEVLILSDTRITNRALTYLKDLPNLTDLALANTRIADNGIANLEELKQLKKLNLGNTRVSPQGVRRLRKALPETTMEGSGVIRR